MKTSDMIRMVNPNLPDAEIAVPPEVVGGHLRAGWVVTEPADSPTQAPVEDSANETPSEDNQKSTAPARQKSSSPKE